MNLPLRRCSTCHHWAKHFSTTSANGYLEAVCQQSKDPRDHVFKRGSDKCGHWAKIRPRDQEDLFGWPFTYNGP